ncbi:hypothetical protein D1007_50627 [Hordeum vulgare]|nr:hypothetical protein D1007_50627 [Hordeum vulgare]
MHAELLHGGSFSYTELLHAQMYQSMTNSMECDRTDLDNKFNTLEAGEDIHSEQNESPANRAGAENPWNISLFDSMELDKVNDEQNYQQPSTFAREEQQLPSKESEDTPASEKQNGTHNSRQGQEEEFLNEDDIQNFLENEEASDKEGNLRNVDSVTKPAVGMRFKSKQEGQEFFNFYSHVAGFSITTVAVKRTSSKKRNNEITQITMKCNKHGKTKEVEAESVVPIRKSTIIAKTNCKLVLKGVGAKFSVTSFLREYDRIIDVIQDREQECDHLSRNKKVALKKFWSKYGIETQVHELYNIGIFRKFQKKMEDTTRLHITEHEKDRSYLVYQAENYPLKERRKRQYLVQMDLNYEEYSCICCGFQKDGLLCSHILKVMLHLNREKIPEKYIIDRWRKSDQKIHSTDPPPIVAENSTLRYNVLQRKLVYVSSNASKKKRKYEYFLREIDRIQKRLEEMDEESESDMNVQSGSTRTVTVVATNIEAEETTSR